jgi:hypothetical protein
MRWVGLLPSTSAAATLASSSNSMKSGWAVARLPHHNDGAHLPEAGNVLPRLLRTRRDAADYELLAMPGHCRGASTSAAPQHSRGPHLRQGGSGLCPTSPLPLPHWIGIWKGGGGAAARVLGLSALRGRAS